MGTPTYILDALAAQGITELSAPAGTDTPGGVDMTITDTKARKLARRTLKGDVASAAEAIVLLQDASLTPGQADLLRAVVSFSLAEVAEAPAEVKERGTQATNGGTALAARVRQLADAGERTNRAIRAKKLGYVDPALTVELVGSLSDEDCLLLVAAPVVEATTVMERLA